MHIKYPSPRYRRRQTIKQAIAAAAAVIGILSALGLVGRMDYDYALDNEARPPLAWLDLTHNVELSGGRRSSA